MAWLLVASAAGQQSAAFRAAAEGFHRRAVERAPESAEILNNYGIHQWGRKPEADAETQKAMHGSSNEEPPCLGRVFEGTLLERKE